MSIIIILTIALSLSMDAFSLSLAYGTLNLEKKDINKISIIVGIYHFIMPLLGLTTGKILIELIQINPNMIVTIVLSFIGIEMIIDSFKKEEAVKIMSQKELLLFGLAVSIDSFSVGIGLEAITKKYLLSVLTFSISSFTFTYVGLMIGKKINNIIGHISTLIGGLILIIIGITYII